MDELEKRVSEILERVLGNILTEQRGTTSISPSSLIAAPMVAGGSGLFDKLDDAIAAAGEAQRQLAAMAIGKRKSIITGIRDTVLASAESLAKAAWEETKMGRYEDKVTKNRNAALLTPGVEDLPTEAFRGDEETVVVEYGPFGLATSITPITNPTSTVINHGIGLIAAGNSVVFAPHPGSRRCVQETIRIMNQAIIAAGGPPNLVVTVAEPSIEAVNQILRHPEIRLVVATGGHNLVDAGLSSGKKCIAGGPGNPPIIVDETADLVVAARGITDGASFDNNILCISEKVTIALDVVADDLLKAFAQGPAVVLNSSETERLTRAIVDGDHMQKQYIGKNPSVILQSIGKQVDDSVRLVVVDVGPAHPLVEIEQLMPVMPLVRVRDFEEAMKLAKQVEHGFRHTAGIYSSDMHRVSHFIQLMEVTLMVHNKPSFAGLGVNGAGKYTSTLAGPTGEGVTTARCFARQRRYLAPNSAL